MPKRVDWGRRLAVQAEWQELVLIAFDNVVRYDPARSRWYSRDPRTTEWEPDRTRGRRLKILEKMVTDTLRTRSFDDEHEEDFLRSLRSEGARYKFLKDLSAELDAVYYAAQRDAPNPGYGTETDETIDQ